MNASTSWEINSHKQPSDDIIIKPTGRQEAKVRQGYNITHNKNSQAAFTTNPRFTHCCLQACTSDQKIK